MGKWTKAQHEKFSATMAAKRQRKEIRGKMRALKDDMRAGLAASVPLLPPMASDRLELVFNGVRITLERA